MRWLKGDKDETADAVNWLKMYKDPESKLLDLWHKTARLRLGYIHGPSTDEPVTLNDILNEWPRYKDQRGHILVSRGFFIFVSDACFCNFLMFGL